MPEFHCPLCGGARFSEFDRQVWRGYPLFNLICDRCGLVFQGAESPARREEFYTSEYRQIYQGTEEPTPKDLTVQRERAANLTAFLARHGVPQVNRHLDVGASAGVFLDTTRRQLGAQPVGVEPGKAYRAYAQSQDIKMYASLDEMVGCETEPFDLLSLIHVLEHLPDPVGSLAALRQDRLHPQGYLLLEVPNLYAHDSFEVAHLVSFSPHTLVETVKQAGFQVVAVGNHGRPRSRLLRLYTLLLARPLPATGDLPPVRPEKGVYRKRSLGMGYRRLVERLFPSLAWLPTPDLKS